MLRSRSIVLSVLALLLVACGGDGPTGPDATIALIDVTGPTATVEIGKTVQLTATPRDAADKSISGATITWSSSSGSIATVSSSGLVTGVAAGQATITASAGGKSATKIMTVIQGVASITISGATSSEVGATTTLTATPKDASGAAISGLTVTWTSSEPTIIAVANGVVTATRIGSAVITASVASATATIGFTSSLTPYIFNFAAGVSSTDMQTIRDGVQYAHAYHQTVFGRQIKEATTVAAALQATGGCSQGGAAAFTGPHTVTFCVGNPGWTQNPPILRQKIVQHETFHVWQYEYHWLGNPNTAGAFWVIEGSAELMGFKGIDSKGLIPFNTAITCQIKQVADFQGTLPALSSVEGQSFQTTVGPIYSQSMLAMDQLTTTGGGLGSLKTYGDAIAAGTAWQTAFQTSFGMTTTAFYQQFPAYRAGQPIPAQYLCGV